VGFLLKFAVASGCEVNQAHRGLLKSVFRLVLVAPILFILTTRDKESRVYPAFMSPRWKRLPWTMSAGLADSCSTPSDTIRTTSPFNCTALARLMVFHFS
jgi:hypothetical protein